MEESEYFIQMDDAGLFGDAVEVAHSDSEPRSLTPDVSMLATRDIDIFGPDNQMPDIFPPVIGHIPELADDNDTNQHQIEAVTDGNVGTSEPRDDLVAKGSIEGDLAENDSPLSTSTRVEVAIPEMPHDLRDDYSEVRSNVIEQIRASSLSSGDRVEYDAEFTDGRAESIPLDLLLEYDRGKAALRRFKEGTETEYSNMTRTSRKRKTRPGGDRDSDSDGVASHIMELGDDPKEIPSRSTSPRPKRVLRSREPSNRPSLEHTPNSHHSDLEDDGDISFQSTRNLRTRQSGQLKLTNMTIKNSLADQDQDELASEPLEASDEDEDFMPVISDITSKKGRPSRTTQRSRRLQTKKTRARHLAKPTKQGRKLSEDSDIEFEQPRRSSRANRNRVNMLDDALMDEDSFYLVDDKSPAVPKIMSIREVFQPISADSAFGSVHMQTCHVCGSSKQRGQILYCQGCSLAFHKNCIGYRSAREHMVTKVGDENFVLQCRFCINISKKKDINAPAHSMCQECRKPGNSCSAFSQRKTSRQEEKLREENDGDDPITPVDSKLVNNGDNVLFRCTSCHRGWHQDHLPSTGTDSIGTDLKAERLKDYSVDWQCNECSSTKCNIHRLVAWRPINPKGTHSTYKGTSEDAREYLVKWIDKSYVHCSWMTGAWVFGVAAANMRISFGKRAAEQDLLKLDDRDAIPNDYIMPDIIFDIKVNSTAARPKSKADDVANVSRISKIYVKYLGLGYDDVVWDSPPTKENPEIFNAFVDAYHEYAEGKHFRSEPFSKIRERIKSYKDSKFREVDTQPAGLKRGKLMGYQIEGLNWLLQNFHQGRSVVLADEMGLGKTVQVVSLVTSLIKDKPRCWPFLIVVPNATCSNWRREFKQWAPDIRVVAYHGGRESQDLAYNYELFPNQSTEMKAQVVIMSYDSAQDPRTSALFKSVHWQGLVVDEGQRLKNDQNLLYTALQAMKIPFRLLLTGTPLQNNKRELFNLLHFIDEAQNAEKLDMEFELLDKHNLPKLHDKIRPYFLRRTKAGVLKFLPPMAQIILPVTMTILQEKLSKSIMAKNPQLIQAIFANSKMNKKERGSLNNILMQLRKCLCHPFVYSDAIEERHHDSSVLHRNLVEASAKLILLEIMLPKLKAMGHRVLIFSQFLQQLDIVEDFLTGMGVEFRRLDGSISSLEKQRRIDAFNEPGSELFAFLLSTRAGGVGINLATADTVIIMDPDFNPHQDIQALSRAHRIGQKNKVLCFQLMTKDSVEERIMQAGRKKMALDHALIESMDDDELAGDDLESILKHGAQALFSDDYQKTAIRYDSASVDKLLDRSQMEQTATNEEGSAEAQFNYARVWANDKLGFEDNEDIVEEEAPEPINSSVWDEIIAHREEESRREAEASREVLGRGARRRLAINYKTNTGTQMPLPDDMGAESSDSSDNFAGAESPDDSDDDAGISTKGKRRKTSHTQLTTPAATPSKNVKSRNINSQAQQSNKQKSSRSTNHQSRNLARASPFRKSSPLTPKSAVQGVGRQRRIGEQLQTPTKPPQKMVATPKVQNIPTIHLKPASKPCSITSDTSTSTAAADSL